MAVYIAVCFGHGKGKLVGTETDDRAVFSMQIPDDVVCSASDGGVVQRQMGDTPIQWPVIGTERM
jgi:hypothetical protein